MRLLRMLLISAFLLPLCASAQVAGGFNEPVSAPNLSGTNTGDVTLGAVGSADAKGATISGQVLSLSPADASHPGIVTTGAQAFGGQKTVAIVAPAGTASVPGAKLTSGVTLTAPQAGALEFVGDDLFFSVTTGPTRKTVAFTDTNITGTAQGLSSFTGLVVTAPAAATDACTPGQYAIDGSYFYICQATNTWLRAAIVTWP